MFAVYIDGLLEMLESNGVGCYYGGSFVGALAYADDVVGSNACRFEHVLHAEQTRFGPRSHAFKRPLVSGFMEQMAPREFS